MPTPIQLQLKLKTYTSARNYKCLKTVHLNNNADVLVTTINRLQEYLETNYLHTDNFGDFDVI